MSRQTDQCPECGGPKRTTAVVCFHCKQAKTKPVSYYGAAQLKILAALDELSKAWPNPIPFPPVVTGEVIKHWEGT